MKQYSKLLMGFILLITSVAKSQDIKELILSTQNDMNAVSPGLSSSAQGYFFRTNPGWANKPSTSYVNYGIVAAFDANSFHQVVFGNGEDEMYLRTYAFGFKPWRKIWHSGNLPLAFHQWQDYIGNNVSSSLNDMPANTSVFSYINGYNGINTNSPVSGPAVHFSGFSTGGYGLQLQSNYLTGDLYTRVKNDDIQQWLGWRKILSENASGKVGIGTTDPAGTLSFQNVNLGWEPIGITWYNGGNDPTSYGIHRTSGEWIGPDYQQLRLGFQTGIVIDPGTAYGKSYLDIQGNGIRVTNGSVGIATTDTKGYKLAVNGAAIFTKAVVKNYNNWPDYVFDSSYQLPSLDSVSLFIQANKHLPDMPSAATVEKDGHDLGEVQKQLLKKVEELTLYVIELKKEIEVLKKK